MSNNFKIQGKNQIFTPPPLNFADCQLLKNIKMWQKLEICGKGARKCCENLSLQDLLEVLVEGGFGDIEGSVDGLMRMSLSNHFTDPAGVVHQH